MPPSADITRRRQPLPERGHLRPRSNAGALALRLGAVAHRPNLSRGVTHHPNPGEYRPWAKRTPARRINFSYQMTTFMSDLSGCVDASCMKSRICLNS